jgi:hypothetical protein
LILTWISLKAADELRVGNAVNDWALAEWCRYQAQTARRATAGRQAMFMIG